MEARQEQESLNEYDQDFTRSTENFSEPLRTVPLFFAGIALGAIAMFLFDPIQGRGRRARIGQKGIKAKNQASLYGGKLARHLKNKATGANAKVMQFGKTKDADDQTLEARVRSEFGRMIKHTHAIDVQVEEGVVTLSGPILSSEVDPLIKCVENVPGVYQVINELDAHETAENIPSLQGEGKAYLQ